MNSIPSLFAETPQSTTTVSESPQQGTPTLVDLLYDGFHMLMLLRTGRLPEDAERFSSAVERLLDAFERQAKKLNFDSDDIHDAKYAFCAVVDEFILSSRNQIRETWERRPLQLLLFGEQLAGEHFFDRLEQARSHGTRRLAVLEVFQMCLLTGFKGRYVLEGPEKLRYLILQLGDQITHIKGKPSGFAPHWAPPDNIIHSIRNDIPVWIVMSVLALLGLLAYSALLWHGRDSISDTLGAYANVVQPPANPPNLTITLP
jgi:type VI secretion system protein ImpK